MSDWRCILARVRGLNKKKQQLQLQLVLGEMDRETWSHQNEHTISIFNLKNIYCSFDIFS